MLMKNSVSGSEFHIKPKSEIAGEQVHERNSRNEKKCKKTCVSWHSSIPFCFIIPIPISAFFVCTEKGEKGGENEKEEEILL